MAKTIPIYASFEDNILIGSTVTADASPLSTYSLDTLLSMNPAARVRFGTDTVTITFTLGAAALGEVLIIPMHNLTPGSGSVLTLTNGAGLSVAVTIPALEAASGFPPTLAVDFSAEVNTTDDVWNLVIASNAANVILGGAVAIYPKKTFENLTIKDSVSWHFEAHDTWNMTETPNEYATPYVQDYGTLSKVIRFTAFVLKTMTATYKAWFLENHGRVRVGLFWPDPADASGAYLGRWQKTFDVMPYTPKSNSIDTVFDEWPKGEVL